MPGTDTGKSCFHWQPDRSPLRGLWVLAESFLACAPWWAQCELSHQLWMAQEGTNTHKGSEACRVFVGEEHPGPSAGGASRLQLISWDTTLQHTLIVLVIEIIPAAKEIRTSTEESQSRKQLLF